MRKLEEFVDFIASFKGDRITPSLMDNCKMFHLFLNERDLSITQADQCRHVTLTYRSTCAESPAQQINKFLKANDSKDLRYDYHYGDRTEYSFIYLKPQKHPLCILETYEKDYSDRMIHPVDIKLDFIICDNHQIAEEHFYKARYDAVKERAKIEMKSLAYHLNKLDDAESVKMLKELMQMTEMTKVHSCIVNEKLLDAIEESDEYSPLPLF